jgi:hypothetical protein
MKFFVTDNNSPDYERLLGLMSEFKQFTNAKLEFKDDKSDTKVLSNYLMKTFRKRGYTPDELNISEAV